MEHALVHLKSIIKYAMLTGCRLQEILQFRKDDIDWEKEIITIRPEINKCRRLDKIPIYDELNNS